MAVIIPNQERITYGVNVEMVTHLCIECGMPFAVPSYFDGRRRNDAKSFYCPNGHSQAYTKSEADRIREQAKREKEALESQLRQAERSKEFWNNQYKSERKKAIVLKGQKTRLTNRIKAGVCPCCNRTFQNLANHMKTQHPDHK